jgi:pyrroline-5-carboxylate reductase
MARASATEVAVLRQQVTSRGGSTEAAVAALESAGLRHAFGAALRAAEARARALGDELEAAANNA